MFKLLKKLQLSNYHNYHIYMWVGMIPHPIYYENGDKNTMPKVGENIWRSSYSGRTRTYPYGVSECPVRGTSKIYGLFEAIPAKDRQYECQAN